MKGFAKNSVMLQFHTVGGNFCIQISHANLAALVGFVLRIETGGFAFDGTVNKFPSDMLFQRWRNRLASKLCWDRELAITASLYRTRRVKI